MVGLKGFSNLTQLSELLFGQGMLCFCDMFFHYVVFSLEKPLSIHLKLGCIVMSVNHLK